MKVRSPLLPLFGQYVHPKSPQHRRSHLGYIPGKWLLLMPYFFSNSYKHIKIELITRVGLCHKVDIQMLYRWCSKDRNNKVNFQVKIFSDNLEFTDIFFISLKTTSTSQMKVHRGCGGLSLKIAVSNVQIFGCLPIGSLLIKLCYAEMLYAAQYEFTVRYWRPSSNRVD